MTVTASNQSMKSVSLKFGQPNVRAVAPDVAEATGDGATAEHDAFHAEAPGDSNGSSRSVAGPATVATQVLGELIDLAQAEGFSDLQIQAERLIYANGGGSTSPFPKWGKLSSAVVFEILRWLYDSRSVSLGIGEEERHEAGDLAKLFVAERKLDFASEGTGADSPLKKNRFRVQAHFSNRGMGVTIRLLRNKIAALDEIGIPPEVVESVRQRISKKQGIGLIVGPTGSGKTTTLAALIDWVRRNQNKHIVTIEDPIEYVYADTVDAGGSSLPAPALVTQQEVGAHVRSFEQGMVDALRKKPDIILVGEIRTAETLRIALEAAETGHFILSTLHTRGAGKTLGRMRQMFSLEQARSILQQFADVGSFILSQGLLPDVTKRYVLCCEYFAIQEIEDRNAIRKYAEGGFQDVEERLNKPYNRKWNAELKALLNARRITPEVYEQSYQVTGLENK
jgi:twitching motility protein PilT